MKFWLFLIGSSVFLFFSIYFTIDIIQTQNSENLAFGFFENKSCSEIQDKLNQILVLEESINYDHKGLKKGLSNLLELKQCELEHPFEVEK